MQAVWFFISVFFGILGGYCFIAAVFSAVTDRLSRRYIKSRRKKERS